MEKFETMKPISLVLYFLLTTIPSIAQDTIRVEPTSYYSSQDEPVRGKGFASRVKYAREDIIFNAHHKRIEYCYYYDKERTCFGDTYKLIGDTILQINDSSDSTLNQYWKYEIQDNGDYLVYRHHNGIYETGYAKELVPFILKDLYILSGDTSDTLWSEHFINYNPNSWHYEPQFIYPKKSIKDKIYDLDKVDSTPTFLSGQLLPDTIQHYRTSYCYGEPHLMLRNMIFIVTSEGEIINIEQGFGSFDMSFCPYYIQELMIIISKFGPLKPATINGDPVSVRYSINIKMN